VPPGPRAWTGWYLAKDRAGSTLFQNARSLGILASATERAAERGQRARVTARRSFEAPNLDNEPDPPRLRGIEDGLAGGLVSGADEPACVTLILDPARELRCA
jgi:hypothetical protein